jgi:uncharacterized protein YaaN involved in tellurite resistance
MSAVETTTAPATQLQPLAPPAAVAAVAPQEAKDLVQIDPSLTKELDTRALAFASELAGMDTHSAEFQDKLKALYEMGNSDIKAASAVSNRLLDKPVSAMGKLDSKSSVSHSLIDLRHTVEDLDPSRQGDLFSAKKLFGILPFGSHLRDYFGKYQSAQSHLNKIIDSLLAGQDELVRDNADIGQERINLWKTMESLRQYVYLAQQLDDALVAEIAKIELTDPERAKALKEDALFYVRQKVQDLLTQLAVAAQGYMALDMVGKNNLELIKGVDRATTTTVSALRTAVIISQALTDQKLVLDQINALNTTTSNMIESTSVLLKEQGTEIHKQAVNATVDVEKLKRAFANIYAALDEIDTYKVAALDTMKQTVDTLNVQVNEAQHHIDRMQKQEVTQTSLNPVAGKGELTL